MTENNVPTESISMSLTLTNRLKKIKELEEELSVLRQGALETKQQFIDSVELSIHRAISSALGGFNWPGGIANQTHKSVMNPDPSKFNLEDDYCALVHKRWLAHLRLGESGSHIDQKYPQIYLHFEISMEDEKEFLVEFYSCLEGFSGDDEFSFADNRGFHPLQLFEAQLLANKTCRIKMERFHQGEFQWQLSDIVLMTINESLSALNATSKSLERATNKFNLLRNNLKRVTPK